MASSLRPKKARMSRSKVKTMIIVFFDSCGIVHKEFVPPGLTVNHAFYKDVLERLQKRVQAAHTALSIREFLAKKNIPVLPHLPYSPDLAPCDFYLFPKVEIEVEGSSFRDDGKHTKNCNR